MNLIKTPFDGETAKIIGNHHKSGHQALCLGGIQTPNGKALYFKSDEDDSEFVVSDPKEMQFYQRNSVIANHIKAAIEDIKKRRNCTFEEAKAELFDKLSSADDTDEIEPIPAHLQNPLEVVQRTLARRKAEKS